MEDYGNKMSGYQRGGIKLTLRAGNDKINQYLWKGI